jgi:hypothetical protein
LVKVASFGLNGERTLVQMEQTFKPEAKAADKTEQAPEVIQEGNFYKSNTYIKLTGLK